MDYSAAFSTTSSDLIGPSVSQRSSPKSDLYYYEGSSPLKPPDLLSTATFVGHVPVVIGPCSKPEGDPSKMLSTSSYHTGHNDHVGYSSRLRSSQAHLKLLPDTSLHRYTSQDEDSGFGNSLNASSRWRSASNLSTSLSMPSPKHNYTTLDSSFTVPTRSHEYAAKSPYDTLGRSHELTSSSLRKNGYSKSVSSYDGDKYSPIKHTSFSPSTYGSIDRGMDRSMDRSMDRGRTKSINVLDVENQLDESEKRRSLLVEKLTEARNTIKLQSDRLDEAESGNRNNSFTLDDHRNREREYKKKIDVLEQDKQDYQNRRLESLKQREELQDRIGGLENEIGLLKTSYNLMETESQRRDDLIQQKSQAIVRVEEENLNLIKGKDSLSREASAMKESLEIARNRNEWLENQTQDNKTEVTALRQENKSLSVENRSLHNQNSELKESNMVLKEECSTHMNAMKQLHQDKLKLQRQQDSFHDSVADLKANLASTTSDKERYFQEKLDLHQKLQNAILDRETAIKEKYAIEERVNELSVEMAQSTLHTDKKKEDWRRMEDELSAVKKVGEVLSLELASTKANLEKALERNQSLEQTKKIAFQQHTLYEQEIKSLENQLNNFRKSMDSIQDSHRKERDGLDGNSLKLREEMRQVKAERNQMELRLHEIEATKKQTEQSLKQDSKLQRQELETWKNSCETMTASLSRKEMEVQQLSKKLHDLEEQNMYPRRDHDSLSQKMEVQQIGKKLHDLEEQTGYLKLNEQSYQTQYGELMGTKEQLERLERDNRRLQQERSENQQVIQLLEMQKNILAKTSESNLNKSHDTSSHDTTQLQCQLEMLTSENQANQVKVQQLEQIRDELIREKEERLSSGDLYFPSKKLPASQTGDSAISSNSNKIQELEKQNRQLREVNTMVTEQLTRVEKQNTQLRAKDGDTTAKHDLRRLEIEKDNVEEENKHLKSQYEHLEEMYQKYREENNTHRVGTQDLVSLQKDKQSADDQIRTLQRDKHSLDDKVESFESEIRCLKSDKKDLQEQSQTLQKQLADVNKQLFESSHDQTKDVKEVAGLQKAVTQLQTELEDSKEIQYKQDNLILSLKDELEDEKTKKPHRIKQSLDDVGSELNIMRKELQKLMGVIKTKDQEIESLGSELKTTKKQVTYRDKMIDELRTSSDFERAGLLPTSSFQSYTCEQPLDDEYYNTSREQERDEYQDKLTSLEKENSELQEELDSLRTEQSTPQSELRLLEQQLKDTQAAREEESQQAADKLRRELAAAQTAREEDSQRAADKLRRELTAKDRQIESLEEQLRRNTTAEIRRLKREAGKVELLKQENRRLTNEMVQVKGSTLKPGSTTEDQDSWDSDSVHDTHNPLNKSLAEEMDEAEHQTMKEIAEDDDLRNVVAMLENVEFNETLPLSIYNEDINNRTGNVYCNVDYESSGEDTPRNESPRDSSTYKVANNESSRLNGDVTPVYGSRPHSPRSRTNGTGSNRFEENSKSGSDQSEDGRRPAKKTKSAGRFRSGVDDGAFPSPKLSDTPKRSSSSNYKLTSAENHRPRSRSPPNSPSRSYERSRSQERSSHNYDSGNTYVTRSRSYDRRSPGRSISHDVTNGSTTGYGSLTSSIGLRSSMANGDLNARSLPDAGPRYRSSLNDLGPSPGETKEERRKRMRELLRTLDKTTSKY